MAAGGFRSLVKENKMFMEEKNNGTNNESTTEDFLVKLTNPMLYDRLHTLSVEYSVSVDFLVNTAVEHLIADVDFIDSVKKSL